MFHDLNVCYKRGNITNEPELKMVGDVACLRFRMGMSRNSRHVSMDSSDYSNVVIWGYDAEDLSKVIKKGSSVWVEGREQSRSYVDKTNQKRTITEVVATCCYISPTDLFKGRVNIPPVSEVSSYRARMAERRETAFSVPAMVEEKPPFVEVDIPVNAEAFSK